MNSQYLEGILFKPIPDISKEKGSLRKFFKRSAKEILKEARKNDYKRENFWRRYNGGL